MHFKFRGMIISLLCSDTFFGIIDFIVANSFILDAESYFLSVYIRGQFCFVCVKNGTLNTKNARILTRSNIDQAVE